MDSAKSSSKQRKGQVGIYVNGKSWALNIPRQWFNGKQLKKTIPGLEATEDNYAIARNIADELERDFKKGKLDDGNGNFSETRFNEILKDYGIVGNLRIVRATATSTNDDPPNKPELGILEIWDIYCEYKRPSIAETHYQVTLRKDYTNPIKKGIQAVGENALSIRNWLTENYALTLAKRIISQLDKAHQLALKQKLISHNTFSGMADEIVNKKQGIKIIDPKDKLDEDNDLLNKNKSFTWDEVQKILEYVEKHPQINYLYNFIKFKFLTGCRTGEAIAFWFCDIDYENERILIRRTYSDRAKIYKPTKNNTVRMFPMPKNGELWNLLKSVPQGEPNENVFKGKRTKRIATAVFHKTWAGNKACGCLGIIPELIKQGKVRKYLSPYNTRHSFITHQIFDLGREPSIVNAWCEHSENVSAKHYRDTGRIAGSINPDLPAIAHGEKTEVEMLKDKIEEMQKMIERLTQE